MANNNDGKMAGNKGEWSELYAFLRLLSQGRVYAANEKVEKIDNVYYPILKIIREEQKGEIYDYCIENDSVVIETQSRRIMTIDRESLGEEADKLLEEIAAHSGSFEVEEVASFVNGIKVTKLKAPSTDNPIDKLFSFYFPHFFFIIRSSSDCVTCWLSLSLNKIGRASCRERV